MSTNLSGFRVVIIGGGTGTPILAKALEDLPIHRTIIVTAFDTGGSTGELSRKYQTTRAMGDFRRAFAALYHGNSHVWPQIWGLRFRHSAPDFGGKTLGELLRSACETMLGKEECEKGFTSLKFDSDPRWYELFSYRFPEKFPLAGHVVGNLIILACEKTWGRAQGLRNYSELLKIHGVVLPVSLDDAHIVYTLSDGTEIVGEASIMEREEGDTRSITGIRLDKLAIAYIPVLDALRNANLIIIAMGDLFSSDAPNFEVEFIREAIRDSRAPLVYFPNLMSRATETHGFDAAKFPETLLSLGIGRSKFDGLFVNTEEIPPTLVEHYEKTERSIPVEWKGKDIEERLKKVSTQVFTGYFLDHSGFDEKLIRHDPYKIRDAILLYVYARQSEEIRFVVDLDDSCADTTLTMQGDPARWPFIRFVPGAQRYFAKFGKDSHIVTFGDRTLQHNKYKTLHLDHYVGQRFYVSETIEGKRSLLGNIIERFGLNPRNVIVIGDRPDCEIREGNRYGCRTVRVRRPGGSHSHEEPKSEEEVANYEVVDFNQILELPFLKDLSPP